VVLGCTARARSSYHARRPSWPVFLKTLATPTRRWRSVVPMHSYLCGKNRITNAAQPGPDTRSTAARQIPSRHLFGQCTRPAALGTRGPVLLARRGHRPAARTADEGGGGRSGPWHGSARADGRRPATAAPARTRAAMNARCHGAAPPGRRAVRLRGPRRAGKPGATTATADALLLGGNDPLASHGAALPPRERRRAAPLTRSTASASRPTSASGQTVAFC